MERYGTGEKTSLRRWVLPNTGYIRADPICYWRAICACAARTASLGVRTISTNVGLVLFQLNQRLAIDDFF